MKTRLTHYALLAAVAFGFACPPAHGQSTDRQAPSPIIATIDAQQTAPPVPSLISALSQWLCSTKIIYVLKRQAFQSEPDSGRQLPECSR